MRFIVFENLKHFTKTVTRVYPVHNVNFFQYDKANKIFKIQHTDGSWHTITNTEPELITNEKAFDSLIKMLPDKVTFS